MTVCILGIVNAATEVNILYTNNTNGALENCLCPGKSYGSLEKRVKFIRDWMEVHPNTLILDAGDFLSASKKVLKDSIAFRAYEMIPYDAVGLGDQEFFRGVKVLAGLMKGSSLTFVATNLVKPELPGVLSEIIVVREGITFGILSVMGSRIFNFYPGEVKSEIEVLPYEAVLKDIIPGLRDRVDVIILLSHMGIEDDRELVKTVQGIDLLIGSHTQTVLESPEKVGETLIVQAGKDGYYVGKLTLRFDDDKKIKGYDGELIPMDITLPNDSTVVNMIIEYNRLSRLKAGKRVERIPPILKDFIIASTDRCSSCHPEQLSHWSTTLHAVAFETLTRDHKDKSPTCLVCHTTGFGRDDGYLNYNITAGLKNVNCTECHYVSTDHLREPVLNRSTVITEETCVRCHDIANSPTFEYMDYLDKIRHPLPELVVSEPIKQKKLHEVQEGETLWFLAGKYLGDEDKWVEIFNVNRDLIHDPNLIFPGQKIIISYNHDED
ncbi:MAG: LysM peptidoglycan-binding domain-containing protein [Candidatus Marinimicrobia bacterium]|nr:LysM peptidoglycan-binding domain-containing protein [Candidatus Neomarinimicrobiota bacterium]